MYTIIFLLSVFSLCNGVNVKSNCPSEWFSAEIAAISDVVIPGSVLTPKPDNFTFLRDIMMFSEEEIEATTQAAINFFNTRFGLDFSKSQPNELDQRVSGNASFFPFFNPVEFRYLVTYSRWIISGIQKTHCFSIRSGGFLVRFSEEQLLFGTYGGEEGKIIRPGEFMVYAFFNIPVCAQEPIVIRYTSASPFRYEPVDGFGIINFDLYHHVLGEGIAQGVFRIVPLPDQPGMVHYSVRNLLTFPANPGLTAAN